MSRSRNFRLALLASVLLLNGAPAANAEGWGWLFNQPDQSKPVAKPGVKPHQAAAKPHAVPANPTHASTVSDNVDDADRPFGYQRPARRQEAIANISSDNYSIIAPETGPAAVYGGQPGVRSAVLPPDADPNYSTPVDLDGSVDFKTVTQREVADPTGEAAGTLTINTAQRKLFLSLGGGRAIEYRIAVGKQGFSWKGVAEVGRKAYWPGWTPPPEMIDRHPDLPNHMDGSMSNPLGARALYLFMNNKDTLFRIHGTTEPKSIGHAASSGCIRMLNADVIDLYSRVPKGARVVVM